MQFKAPWKPQKSCSVQMNFLQQYLRETDIYKTPVKKVRFIRSLDSQIKPQRKPGSHQSAQEKSHVY